MGRTVSSLLLVVLAGCGPGAGRSEEPDPPRKPARLELPTVGRAVRLTSRAPGRYRGEHVFDVVEVEGERVLLRAALGFHDEPGTWVDWRDVLAWEEVGPAVGDDRDLGIPLDVQYAEE